MLLGGTTLGSGLPLCLFRGRLLFGRERGSCFVWVPKPKGEDRSVGGRTEYGLPRGAETLPGLAGDPGERGGGRRQERLAAWGRGSNPAPSFTVSLLPIFVIKKKKNKRFGEEGHGKGWERKEGGRHWWNLNKTVNCILKKNYSKWPTERVTKISPSLAGLF